jgi:negative regulator of sigma E activity
MRELDRRIQAYLDGELRQEDLPNTLRRQAEDWDRLLSAVSRTAPDHAPEGLDRRVLAAIEAEHTRSESAARGRPVRDSGVLEWALRPRSIRVSPIAAAGLAAALLLAVLRPWGNPSPDVPDAPVTGTVYVQFVVEAESAESVHLAGDFSDWQPSIELTDPDGDGVWSGRVPLEPGVHEYMFVIDGSRWMTDPNAAGSRDDGFGRRNSLLAVSATSGT